MVKQRDLIKAVEALGFVFYRSGGRHDVYIKPETRKTVVIPRHREIPEFTAKAILNQAAEQEPDSR